MREQPQSSPSPRDVAQGAPAASSASTPETGDLVVDSVLRDLSAVDTDDLDGTLTAGEAVHATLTSRLSDLGS